MYLLQKFHREKCERSIHHLILRNLRNTETDGSSAIRREVESDPFLRCTHRMVHGRCQLIAGRSEFLCALPDHFGSFPIMSVKDYRNTLLDNPRLLKSNLRDCIPEILRVVQADRCNDGCEGMPDHICRVQPASHPDLQDRIIHLFLPENQKPHQE